MAVTGRTDSIEPVTDVRNGFQIMRLGRLIGLFGRRRQFQGIEIPVLIPRALGNHQRVGGFGERRGTTDNLFPIGVGSRGQIMFAPGVDQNAIDPPDDLRGGRQYVFHECFHVHIRFERRRDAPVLIRRAGRRGETKAEGRDQEHGKPAAW